MFSVHLLRTLTLKYNAIYIISFNVFVGLELALISYSRFAVDCLLTVCFS